MRQHARMGSLEQRRYPRRRAAGLLAHVSHDRHELKTAVIDLSEGGAFVEWTLPESIAIGTPVRLRFVLAGAQTIDVDARIVRLAAGRAAVEFLPAQQDIVRQMLSEARSED